MFLFKINGEVQSSRHNPVNIPNFLAYTDLIEVEDGKDGMFQESWDIVAGAFTHDMTKAKEIVHVKRRAKRDEMWSDNKRIILDDSFGAEPVDGEPTVIEAKALNRNYKSDVDDVMQDDINACVDVVALKSVIEIEGL